MFQVRRFVGVVTTAAALALAVTSCAGGSDDAGAKAEESRSRPAEVEQARAGLKKEVSTRFVGTVEGSDALIGLTDRAGQLSAYVCDSAQLAEWFSGEVSGSVVQGAIGALTLQGDRVGDKVTGKVMLPDGTSHAFTAAKTTDPAAGLFEAAAIGDDGQLVRAGWVRLPGGGQRGAAKTGSVVQPVVQISNQTRVLLGGTSTPVPVSPPNPVTTAWCEDSIKEYWSQIDFYTELKDAGKKESAGVVLKRIQSLDQALEDFGCWP